MLIMAASGVIIAIFSLLYLRPVHTVPHSQEGHEYPGSFTDMCLAIVKNYRNWLDCFMVILLDTPVSIIGRNSAFNSMILMGSGGGFKQIGACLLAMSPLMVDTSNAGNLLILIAGAMLVAFLYVCLRSKIFTHK
ncbi:MAG: hypothetical protein Q7V63_04825 [Gammaproteobacteria bacterium]|nr:hypothetical protein [Gammaproteobacteria bacterium]